MDEHPHSEPATPAATPASAPVTATSPADASRPEIYVSPVRKRWNILWREWFRPLLIIAAVMFSFRSAVADWNDVPTGSMKPTILEGDRIFINKVAYDLRFPFTTWRMARWSHPSWGDIVVLLSPEDGKRLVKRVVGLPGDVIDVRSGRLLLNGEVADYLEPDAGVLDAIAEQLEQYPNAVFAQERVGEREHAVIIDPHREVRRRFDRWARRAAPPPDADVSPCLVVPDENDHGDARMITLPCRVPEEHFFMMGDNRSRSRDSRYFGAVHRSSILGQATAVALSVDPERNFMPRWRRFFSALH